MPHVEVVGQVRIPDGIEIWGICCDQGRPRHPDRASVTQNHSALAVCHDVLKRARGGDKGLRPAGTSYPEWVYLVVVPRDRDVVSRECALKRGDIISYGPSRL